MSKEQVCVVNGKEVSTKDNGIARALDGIPSVPKEATDEMKHVASCVVDALIQHGCIAGWMGDTSEAFRRDEMNRMLQSFVDYEKTRVRFSTHANYVLSNAGNLQKYVEPQILNKYAALLGYVINWVPCSEAPNGQYPCFYVRSVVASS